MSFAAAMPLPAVSPTPTMGAGEAVGANVTAGGATGDSGAGLFADLMAMLQQASAATPDSTTAAPDPAATTQAAPPTHSAVPAAKPEPMAMAAAMVVSTIESVATSLQPETVAPEKASADAGTDEQDAPPASADADPNRTALIASLLMAAQPLAAQPAKPATVAMRPVAPQAAPAPAKPFAPLTAATPDADKTSPAPDAATAPAFDKALAASDSSPTRPAGVDAAASGDNRQNDVTQPAPATASAAPQAKAPAPVVTQALAVVRATHTAERDIAPSAPASAFSLQPADAANPVSYTAAAIQADAPAPSPAPAVLTSTLSQTAIQTLSALSVQIGKRVSDGNTKFAVELHPADLGRVDVALTIDRDGKVNAHLDFDTPMTAASFSTHESELRQQLAQAGLNVDAGALTFSSRASASDATSPAAGQAFNPAGSDTGGTGTGNSGSQPFQHNNPQHQQSNPHAVMRALAAASSGADDADFPALSAFSGRSSTLALNLIV